jgi:16S rRNA (cytidine1402-2'-O)-methyltransferase
LSGTLYLVATPIGNLEDITLRALRVLRDQASVIACEDTRQTQKLLEHFQIRKPLLSYHEHNEASRTEQLLGALERGESVALVSDAGTPLISDPGYRVVHEAVAKGYPVVPLPGASAALTALTASGLPTDQFRFIGFLPPKAGARRKALEALADEAATVIAYESPHRILESLGDMSEIFGERPLVLARELTKLHEEFLRGSARTIRDELERRGSVKGEITLVIGRAETQPEIADPLAEIQRLQEELGLDRMEAIKSVAKRLGLPKREVYRLAAAGDNSSPDKCRD